MMGLKTKAAQAYFHAKNEFTTGPVEVDEMIKNDEPIKIIDVRGPQDYAQGHIPGAINLRKGEGFESLSKDKKSVVYCYDEDCHLATEACEELASEGYPVIELQGGFKGWKEHNFPIES
ncbi:putative adenylyltransferase/sulfurtransferase MoeZ [Anaerohalosphaera lusitana]|uniref:Putative adenylyltransferase/sulfurtransferase MoeZ n=1 Tax=Anaerohalosphaera lusitana TaxID=1936003 RepID=A0A1U9NG97_9BACT|nr:rhodanese-like domain-containing protein [Anaerohalosphaera lusitana]AQT66959.1 putative adenylyltransferase/sulfurtransferase MoeZ [Anaerohalosphaera lusitana]